MPRHLASLLVLSLLPSLAAADYSTHRVVAITDAQVILEPGKILDNASIVVRDGVIEAVGVDLPIPYDALAINAEGMTVHAGFIGCGGSVWYDKSLKRSESGPAEERDVAENAIAVAASDNRRLMTPEFQVSHALKFDAEDEEKWRLNGVTARLIFPSGGILAGQSALLSLGSPAVRERLLRDQVFMHLNFQTDRNEYPVTLMGMIAHLRQTLRDADHQRRSRSNEPGAFPSGDPALAALEPVITAWQPIAIVANSEDEIYRALSIADEFRLRPVIVGGAEAWKVASVLRDRNVPVLFDLKLPEEPKVDEKKDSPADPFKPEVPLKVRRDRHRKWLEHIEGPRKLLTEGVLVGLRCEGLDPEKFAKQLAILQEKSGMSKDAVLRLLTTNAAAILSIADKMGSIAPGKSAHLVIRKNHPLEKDSWVRQVLIKDRLFDYRPVDEKTAKKDEEKKDEKSDAESDDSEPQGEPNKATPENAEPQSEQAKVDLQVASEIESDRRPRHRSGGDIVLRGAHVLTVSRLGDFSNADLVIRDGKIEAVGEDLEAPSDAMIVDAHGLYVMPGIIDSHSHMAITGGINESSLSITPEVRIKDVVDSTDVSIYRALAGGVTAARLLHGSANAIGGQDAVIKLRYGQPARSMLIENAEQGVKFALGENVTRRQGRFPSSRMGVEATLVRAFAEAQAYQREWAEFRDQSRRTGTQEAPRRDYRLEALANILSGDWHIHCHCYRADEILMLLRVADRFGFKIRSLQHALEAYKIAPEIARHGCSVSTFSDWWAYKWEAYDATPYNSMLLRQAGVDVCLKSDSDELVRHMYQEAAKMLRYGRMQPEQALEMITLIPARQLGLESRIGSLEPGKDGDVAVFVGHPLNTYSRCVLAMVDGEVYFEEPQFFEKRNGILIAKASGDSEAIDRSLQFPDARTVELPAGEHAELAITGATIYPVDGPPIADATVVVRDGRIDRIGTELQIPDSVAIIEADGLRLYPGFIDAGTKVGLAEVSSSRETIDHREEGIFQPDLRASSAIHPDSELIPVTRAGGVTTVVSMPTSGIVSGQSVLVNLAGWVPREMVVEDPLALHLHLPKPPAEEDKPARPFSGRGRLASLRQQRLNELRALFRSAKLYRQTKEEAIKRRKTPPVTEPRLEALSAYLGADAKPVILHADTVSEIRQAIQFAEELEVRAIISGGRDAWKMAAELSEKKTPVIVGPIMTPLGEDYDPYDSAYANCARLYEAGVPFCIQSDDAANARNLPFEAAMAVSYGLPPEEGLKAITLNTARILGVEKDLGSICEGKIANMILTDGDPLQASTQILAVFVDGKPFYPESKHTRLYHRYLQRLEDETKPPPSPQPATVLKTPSE